MRVIGATLIALLAATTANAQWIDFSFANMGLAIMTEAITPNVSDPNESEKYAIRLSFACVGRNELAGNILPRTGTRFHARLRYADIHKITGRTHVNKALVWEAKQEED